MTEDERLRYIHTGLRVMNIDIHLTLLRKIIKVIDLTDKKKGNVGIDELLKLK